MADGNGPLDMGASWASLSGLAGGGGDPQTAPNIGQGAEVDPVLKQQLEKFKWLGANLKVANEAGNAPPVPTKTTTKTTPDGKKTVAIEGPAELAEYYGKAGSFYQQAMGGMQQELQRMDQQLKQREQAARNQPPWVQLATALSANLAQQKDMPGWVKGLGATAAQLNPSADSIRNQRLGVLGEEAQIAEKGAQLDASGMRSVLSEQQKMRDSEAKQNKEVRETADKISQTLRLVAKPGEAMDPKRVKDIVEFMDPNKVLTPDQVEKAVRAGGAMSDVAKAGKESEAERKVKVTQEIDRLKTDLSEERDVKKQGLKLQELGVQYGLKKDLAVTQAEVRAAEAGQKELVKQDVSLAKISPKEAGRLAAFDTTERYVDWFKDWVHGKQADGSIGPLANYTVGQLPQFMKPAERVKFESMVTHETPRMLQMIGSGTAGGFSMLRFKGSLELLNKMGVSASLRLDQMDEIFGVLYDVNSQQRKGVMDSYPKAPWDKLSSLLGRDADYRPKGWSPLGQPAAASTAGKDHGPAAGLQDGRTGNKGKFVVKNGRWVDAN